MARITSEFDFVGPLGNLSAYKMRGVDRVVLRMKGGPSKKKIMTSRSFEITRRNNVEFGGRARGSKWIMQAFWPLKALGDYNIAGPINALLKHIQELDTKSELGKRAIELSKNPKLLEGFSFNQKVPFDSVIRTSVSCELHRENLSAHIEIPELVPGVNFFAPGKKSLYSMVALLSVVPDLYPKGTSGYQPHVEYDMGRYEIAETPWYEVAEGSAPTTLELAMPTVPKDTAFSLMLSIGLRFGTMVNATTVKQEKYAGCAKVLGMV